MTLQWKPGSVVKGHGPWEWTVDLGDGVGFKISLCGGVGLERPYTLFLMGNPSAGSPDFWLTLRSHHTLEAAQDYAATTAPRLLRGLAERIEREGQA